MPAIVDGPGGGYWATALGLTGWGLAVVYIGDVRPPDIDTAEAYLAGAGLAGVVAVVLRRRGFLISDLGFAASVAVGGLTLALIPRACGTLDDAMRSVWSVSSTWPAALTRWSAGPPSPARV